VGFFSGGVFWVHTWVSEPCSPTQALNSETKMCREKNGVTFPMAGVTTLPIFSPRGQRSWLTWHSSRHMAYVDTYIPRLL